MEFNDNNEKFKLFGLFHVKYAACICGIVGIVGTIAVFGFGVAVFPWSLYETSVNICAMTAFVCFVIGGCVVHYLVLYGLQKAKFRLMVPAIMYQAFLMCLNGITSLIAIGELVSEGNLSNRDETMAKIVLCTCPTIFVLQALMLVVISKCRIYIQCKRRHIRNGLPPPVREVIMFSLTNKVSNAELSVEDAFQIAEALNANQMNSIRRDCDSA